MNERNTELVARWDPEGEQGWVVFLIDDDGGKSALRDEVLPWTDDDYEGVIGTIVIERKPKGYVESLPEFEGW